MPESKDIRVSAGNGHTDSTVAFDYIKSQFFRVIHTDGAIGSVTPNGHIHMALFSERQAIPRRLVNTLNSDGTLGELVPEQSETRGSIVREMDVDVLLTFEAAQRIFEWLRARLDEAKSYPGFSEGEHR
jgi:hypothetical protein